MKSRHIILVLLCLSIGYTAEAQLLKKLRKKAEKAIERTILKKTDSIVTKKTEKAIDSIAKEGEPKKSKKIGETEKNSGNTKSDDKKAQGILDMLLSQTPGNSGSDANEMSISSMGTPVPAPPDNNIKLPDSYKFSYQATIQVKNNQGTVETEYYLQPGESYYAEKQSQREYTEHIVYDNQLNTLVYFAEINGVKHKARQKMDILTKAKIVGAYKDAPNRTVKQIDDKTLLGFNCNGYEISTDSGTTELWVTNDTPATLYGAMFEKRAELPNSPFTKNTMIMEVMYTSKESADENYQMVCTQLQTNDLVFNTKDYKE